MDDLAILGFELGEFGKNCYAIYATPSDLSTSRGKEVLISLIEHYKNTEGSIRDKMRERIALSLAKAASLDYNTPTGQTGNERSVRQLIRLSASQLHG